MAKCCGRLSKAYVLITNILFICLGIVFLALGAVGIRGNFDGATLFPAQIFSYALGLGVLIIVSGILGIIGAPPRRIVILLVVNLFVIIGSLVFQVYIGVKVYKIGANSNQYIANEWASSSSDFRALLQEQFSCCGYNNPLDNPAITNQCNPTVSTPSVPPCYDALNAWVHQAFEKAYLFVFIALALELLAITTIITQLCNVSRDHDDDGESERRKIRKSGIKLNDIMAPDTPTTAGSYTHYNYPAMGESKYGVPPNTNYPRY